MIMFMLYGQIGDASRYLCAGTHGHDMTNLND
jgi:hypothetical protein